MTVMTNLYYTDMQMSLIISILLAARNLAMNFVDNIAANGDVVVVRRYLANITIINITITVQWSASTEFVGVGVRATMISILSI